MILFDALTSYGPYPHRPVPERWQLADLLADMDHVGINGALVRHAQCYSHDAMAGNKRLLRELAPHRQRLHPCWVVGPHHAGDFPAPGELLKAMNKGSVAALQLCPQRHGYPVHRDFLGDLAAALNEQRTPILIFNADLNANYDAWCRMGEIFANCPILMADIGWSEVRWVDTCMRNTPNIHLLFSRCQSHYGVEWFAARHGIERCIFGSALPQMSAGAARAFVDWSLLPSKQAQAFAGANLARLLKVDLQALPPTAAAPDALMSAARRGRPAPIRVLDAHAHVLEYGESGVGATYVMPDGDVDGILRLFNHCGIDGVAMMTWQGPVGCDAATGNELMGRIVKKNRQRVLGLTSIDPLHQDKDTMLRALNRGWRLGFPGIKPYWPRNAIAYNDPAYDPCWDFANKRHMYVLLHTSGNNAGVNSVIDIAKRYPDASFVIAHSGGSWDYAALVAKACQSAGNIYAELTLTPVPNGVVEWLCQHAGEGRVLFGTDVPMRDGRPQLGWVLNSRLSVEQKKLVLGENFAAILARVKWPQDVSLPTVFHPGAAKPQSTGSA